MIVTGIEGSLRSDNNVFVVAEESRHEDLSNGKKGGVYGGVLPPKEMQKGGSALASE